MWCFLLVPSFTDRSFLNNQVIFIDYRSDGTVSSPCFNDMKDHLIVGQLIWWLIIIQSSGIAINVMLSMSRIIIIIIVPPVPFTPVYCQSCNDCIYYNSQILKSWYYTKSHYHHLQATLSTSSSDLLTAVAPFSQYRAIGRSLVQVNCYLAKKGKDSWIWFRIFHYTSYVFGMWCSWKKVVKSIQHVDKQICVLNALCVPIVYR